jgi:hypothetical protein
LQVHYIISSRGKISYERGALFQGKDDGVIITVVEAL